MAGDDATPAVPGYDPDISAELYTTNGETETHMTSATTRSGSRPRCRRARSAADSDPNDDWTYPDDCGSVFEFPDSEPLIQAEFAKNLPFALAVAESADDPDDPVSVVGRTRRTSASTPSTSPTATRRPSPSWPSARSRACACATGSTAAGPARPACPSGAAASATATRTTSTTPSSAARCAAPGAGDDVTVWFEGREGGRAVESEPFTYTVARDTRADVLVIANEDYTGVNPDYPAGTTAPKYAAAHVAAIRAAGYDADVWDVDAQGVPHDLGVLGHYDAVLWYLGDNRITQDPLDEFIQTPFGQLPDIGVAERQQYLTIAVRDYLNEGGKLIHAGETAQYQGLPGISDVVGGLYYAHQR